MKHMKPLSRTETATRKIFFTSLWISVALALVTGWAGLRNIPEPKLWEGTPKFSAARAYALTGKLARGYPYRVPWRPERQGASDFLQAELKKLGYEVSTQEFEETIAGRKITGLQNVYATLKGKELTDEYIVVLAHYDITDTTVEGATDDASGVGTVLELARVFKQGPAPRRNIVFLMTDSEEFGAFWGAHNFALKIPFARNIVAAVSLDFVAPDEQQDILVLVDGLQTGYAPLWLREMALSSIRKVPYKADDTRNMLEFVQRAILIPPADHGAFLKAGIPAINLFGRSTDFSHQMGAIHHTPEDNMSHLKVESFEPYGKAAEILLRSIDAQPPLLTRPDHRESGYWKLTNSRFMTGEAAMLMQFLFFVPFLVYVVLLVRALRGKRSTIERVMKNEAKNFAILLASFLAGYAFLRYLPDLKIITKYEMFPATQKSLVLYRPVYTAIALIMIVIYGLYHGLKLALKSRADRAKPGTEERAIRHSLLGIILGVLIAAAFAKNAYLASLLLMPPAYLWMFMRNSRTLDTRLHNGLLFLGGLASFIAICVIMTSVFHVGVFYWYMFLAVSYGLISVYAAVVAFAVISVGIRILRNLVL